ncbi:thiosulfate oxidation carrier complex protein SoxZ [Pseudorhodoferax sp.]|uniref:thiosulfate oxidation carrier complex protein SoxZ n=1 Tax=Pseudorhodoferax sp. TaxID=1993553 RepID=UPI002DD67C60|nr:thiosulfate oxidation carrier complex protein SoxZ [Pseudorhodoferax sp.]
MAARALVHLPPVLRRGEPFELRCTLAHPMETGYRRDGDGTLLARNIVRRLEVQFDGEPVFAADLHPAVAANPYVAFWLRVDRPGMLLLRWHGDNGFTHDETVPLVLS